MAYSRRNWTNHIAPPLSAANLNAIEQGIVDEEAARTQADNAEAAARAAAVAAEAAARVAADDQEAAAREDGDETEIAARQAAITAEEAARTAGDAASVATAIARANHTGVQAISTITGLQTALDGKEPSIPSGTYPETAALAATTGGALVGVAAYRRLTETTLPGQLQHLERRARTTLDVMAGLTGTNAEQRQEVQARLDWCRDNARTAYFGEGLLTSMDAPLTIECGVDSDDGALLRPAAGVNGLILGTAAFPLTERELVLPRVRRLARAWTTSIGSDFGVRLQNVRNSRVLVREATDFSTGLEMGGLSTGFVGVAYNIIDLGLLGTNAVNVALRPQGDGWVNQNTFRGGRLTHHGIGVAMPGTRQVLLAQATYYPDNNTFVGVSMEGDNPEFHLECYGSSNEWINCRWETVATTPKVKWGATGDSNKPTSRNRIRGGFGSQNIVHTEDVGTGANTLPDYDTAERVRRQFSTSTGGLILQNFTSNDSPIISLLPASASPLSAAISTYGIQLTHSRLRAKASADVAARVDLNAALGRLYFGLGTAEPTTFIRGWSSGSIQVNGGALGFSADNTHDIGLTATTERPRSIHLGTSVTVGGNQVVGARGAAVADATDAASVITQLNALLARLRSGTGHGLIAA